MKHNFHQRYWVLGVAAVGLAVVARGNVGSSNAAANVGKLAKSFAFNPLAFAQLPPRKVALAKKFSWPAVDAFRNTYSVYEGAKPIPVVTGHLIVIGGPGLTNKLGSGATWADVLQLLPKAKADQQVYEGLVNAWLNDNNRGTFAHEDKVVHASECERVTLALFPAKIGWAGHAVSESNCNTNVTFHKVPVQPDEPVIEMEGDTVIAFKPDASAHPVGLHPDLWESWAFSATLMKLGRALYHDVDNDHWGRARGESFQTGVAEASRRLEDALAKPDSVALPAIRKTLAEEPLPHGELLDKAARRTEKAGDLKLAMEVRSHYRPFGMCSMDTRPQEAAREYADLCFRAGDLACYLNLQVKIMGDTFERTAYSTYGEASHDTEAEKLRDIGIDVSRFLRGLIVQYAVEGNDRNELGPWRLARSIVEAGETQNLRAFLRSTATNPAIDSYNRLHTTQVWAYVEFKEKLGRRDTNTARKAAADQVNAVLGRESLHPLAREWVQRQFTN